MNIRPVMTADTENCGRIIYEAFGSIAEKHNFPHDFPTMESAMQMAAMAINAPNVIGFVAETDDVDGDGRLSRAARVFSAVGDVLTWTLDSYFCVG